MAMALFVYMSCLPHTVCPPRLSSRPATMLRTSMPAPVMSRRAMLIVGQDARQRQVSQRG